MKPSFFENLFGSWPGALLLGGFGVVACLAGIAMFQQSPLPAVICMYGGILAVKHAVRLRSRVAHMREFGRQWARVAGWDEPPPRGVKGWLWWAVKATAMLALLVACGGLAYLLWGMPQAAGGEEGRGTVLTIFWALLATVLGVLFHKHIYAFWLARKERKRRYAEGSEVDGKQLPRDFVDQALSVPMRSPGAAWFTQELPEYCLSLLQRRGESATDAADDDSIEDVRPTAEAPRRAIPWGKVGQGAAGVAAALLALVFWGQGFPEAAMSYMPASWFNQEQIRASSERRDARNPVNPQESPPVVVSNAGQAPTAPESPAQLFKRAQDLVLVEGRVELDPEVVSLKLKAAEQGHVIAQYETALAYSALASVAGTPAEKQKHVAEVNRWLSRCATGKWSPCVFWVASSYELGDYGFPKNQNEATRYYRQLLGENGFSDKAQAALQRLGTN